MGSEQMAAVARVRAFLKARTDFYARRPTPRGHVRMHPDSIHAEYGRLDMRDIEVILDALDPQEASEP